MKTVHFEMKGSKFEIVVVILNYEIFSEKNIQFRENEIDTMSEYLNFWTFNMFISFEFETFFMENR